MNEIKIKNNNGILTVSSLQIARDFGKRHDHVVRDIENIINTINGGIPKIGDTPSKSLNFRVSDCFVATKHQNPQNNQFYKSYDVTRDGFALLVMGFTGKEALAWKLKYIEAFNNMERQLIEIHSNMDIAIEKTVEKILDKKLQEFTKELFNANEKVLDIKFQEFTKELFNTNEKVLDIKFQEFTKKFFKANEKALDKKFKKFTKELFKKQKKVSDKIIIEAVSETTKSLIPFFDFLLRAIRRFIYF